MREQPSNRILLAVPVLLGCVVVVGRLPVSGYELLWDAPGTYVYGGLPDGPTQAALSHARTAATALVLTVAYAVGTREVRTGDTVDAGTELYRTIVSPSAISASQLLHYLAFAGRFVGPVVVSAAIGYVVGGGAATTAGAILVVGALAITTTVAVTLSAIATFRLAVHRSRWFRRYSRVVGGVLLAAFGLALFGSRTAVGVPLGGPLGWYGSTALAPDAGSLAVAFLSTAMAVPAAVLGGRAVHSRVPPRSENASKETDAATDTEAPRAVSVLSSVFSRPIAGVAVTTWRRLRRRPSSMVYAVVMAPFPVVALTLTADRFAVPIPFLVAVYAAPLVGVVATLNPLGSEGASLPATLTTTAGPRRLLTGYVVAAGVPGALVVATVTVAAGITTGSPVAVTGRAAVLGAALSVASVFLAIGVGTRLPQYDGVNLVSSSGVQSPRPEALAVLFFTIPLLGLPAVAFGGRPASVPTLAGVVASAAVGAVVAWLSLRASIRTVEAIEL